MTPEAAENLFTRSDGAFRFARWARPMAPVVFGTDDASLGLLKDAMATVAGLADMKLAETDPELGANFLMFFCEDWQELREVPNLDRLLPDFDQLLDRLGQAGANQYRSFGFDPAGAIRICTVLLRFDEHLAAVPAQTLGTSQAIQSLLLWSDTAFKDRSPLALVGDGHTAIVRPDIAALTRAAYDPVIPDCSDDQALAHRLSARAGLLLGDLAE